MGKLAGLFNRGGTNTSDVIRQSTSMTMAYLLEQNRKFEAFMRDKVAELEGRVAAQQQTRLDYFDDNETASPEVVEGELDREREQDVEPTRPMMSLAADVDEPLGLSPAGFPPVGFRPVGPVSVTAQEETVPVEPVAVAEVAPTEAAEQVQAPPSWLVMLGVAEPEPAGEEEVTTDLDQDRGEAEPVEDNETGWSEITAWEDTTEDDPGEDLADEETDEIGATMAPELSEEEPEEEESAGQDRDEVELEQKPAGEGNKDGSVVEMLAGGDRDEVNLGYEPDDEQEEAEPADQNLGKAELEEDFAGEEEMDWPEAEMPVGSDQEEVNLEYDPDGDQEEEEPVDQDQAEEELEAEPADEDETDEPEAEVPTGVYQDGAEPKQNPDDRLADMAAGQKTIRMKVRKQGGVLEIGTGPAIDDEEEDTDTLLPSWLTAKL